MTTDDKTKEIRTSYTFDGHFALDDAIHIAVGRESDFSGCGGGVRDLGWVVKSDIDAARIARGLKKLGLKMERRP